MKTIILSAGQGKRLFPLTADLPKCAVSIHGQSMVEWQVDELIKCGIEDICIVLGYGAEKVEKLLGERYGGRVRTIFNPFFSVADNLGTCWIAREEMHDDFILLNGDTLFQAPVLERLLCASPSHAVTVTTDCKDRYDSDDMKVILDGERLLRIGKDLPVDQVNAESIGMLLFRGEGPELFRDTVENVLRKPTGLKRWYLSVIDELAQRLPVWACCIEGLAWGEVDCPADLKHAERVVRGIAECRLGTRRGALA